MPANSTVYESEYQAAATLSNTTASRSRYTFYILFAIMGLLMFWLVRAYLGVIAFSFVTVLVLRPLYSRFLRWCKGREKPAMSLTLLVGLALPLVLVWSVGRLVIAQAQEFLDLLQRTNQLELLTGSITTYLQPLLTSDDPLALDLVTQLRSVLLTLLSWLAGSLVTLGLSIPTMLTELFVYLILVGALLIRSTLVSLQTYGSFALMVLSLLGGYQLFGLFGVFYGPILLVLFLTMLDVYQSHFVIPGGVQGAEEEI